jgi:hypothetical protein
MATSGLTLALAKVQKPADRFSVLAVIFCIDAEFILGSRPAAAAGQAPSGSPLSGTPDLPRLTLPNIRTLFAHRTSASQTYPLQVWEMPIFQTLQRTKLLEERDISRCCVETAYHGGSTSGHQSSAPSAGPPIRPTSYQEAKSCHRLRRL